MNPIDIQISTEFLPKESDKLGNQFVFSYTIEITNTGTEPAQLLGRHWFITDANDGLQEVQGVGVVGEQPTIEAGDTYTYTSGVALATNSGTMEGIYQMQDHEGRPFDTRIPMFSLVAPQALH